MTTFGGFSWSWFRWEGWLIVGLLCIVAGILVGSYVAEWVGRRWRG